MPTSIGGLELARQVAKAFRIRGAQPDLHLSDDLLPVVNAFTLDDPPYHSKRGLYFGHRVTGVAAEYAFTILGGLPAGDSRVVIVRYVTFSPHSASIVGFSWAGTAAIWAAAADVEANDWDNGGETLNVRGGTSAAWATGYPGVPVAANGLHTIVGPFVVRPGTYFAPINLSIATGCDFFGYADVYDL